MNINSLYIVATPIGNLKDITLRALEILKMVDCIAAEDTRHSLPLLQHYAIAKPLISLHAHNEETQVEKILTRLAKGESIAYISDAGTPLISDPGFQLVKQVKAKGYSVIPIPGACAAIAALSVSGLPTNRFIFEGFLPVKNQARITYLESLLNESRTIILYEAPHRIVDCLTALQKVFGPERQIVLARELTKLFETVLTGTIAEVIGQIAADSNQKRGEFVILIAGNENAATADTIALDAILKPLLAELPVKKAVEIAVKISGLGKNTVYNQALKLKK